jgi:hypothetical protein
MVPDLKRMEEAQVPNPDIFMIVHLPYLKHTKTYYIIGKD